MPRPRPPGGARRAAGPARRVPVTVKGELRARRYPRARGCRRYRRRDSRARLARRGAPARAGRGHRRLDDHARLGHALVGGCRACRASPAARGTRKGLSAGRAPERERPPRPASASCTWAPTSAVRCACPPPGRGWRPSSPATAASRSTNPVLWSLGGPAGPHGRRRGARYARRRPSRRARLHLASGCRHRLARPRPPTCGVAASPCTSIRVRACPSIGSSRRRPARRGSLLGCRSRGRGIAGVHR